jgi:hypothetical protein
MAITLEQLLSCDRDNRLRGVRRLAQLRETKRLTWLAEVMRRASLREVNRLYANQACKSMRAVDAHIIDADVLQDALSRPSQERGD